jgi:hypothetical protein
MLLIIEKSSNRHYSTAADASELADPMPDSMRVVDLGRPFDALTERWNLDTSEVEPIPAPVQSADEVELTRLTALDPSEWTQADRDSALALTLKALRF